MKRPEISARINRMGPEDLDILHEDARLLVIHKPSGMLTHRGWGNDPVTAVDLVKAYLDAETVHPIHRLDRATSGPVLFAKDALSARRLGMSFDERNVEKVAKPRVPLVGERSELFEGLGQPALAKARAEIRYDLPVQPIDATHALNRSAGV